MDANRRLTDEEQHQVNAGIQELVNSAMAGIRPPTPDPLVITVMPQSDGTIIVHMQTKVFHIPLDAKLLLSEAEKVTIGSFITHTMTRLGNHEGFDYKDYLDD